jgi:hypothetical protein
MTKEERTSRKERQARQAREEELFANFMYLASFA